MGRKNRYDRRNRGGQSYERNWEDLHKRGRSRSRSLTPERTEQSHSYSRNRGDYGRYVESRSKSPSPPRRRSYESAGYEERRFSAEERRSSRSPLIQHRREESRTSVEEYGRRQRDDTPDRPPSKPAALRSRSPSSAREDKNKSRKSRNRRSRNEKKYSRNRERDRHGKSGHRPHDIWKPGSEKSPPVSRGRDYSPQRSSPRRRSYSPSPQRDRPSTAGSSSAFYDTVPTGPSGYDRREQWPSTTQSIVPPRSPPRHPSSSRFRPIETERQPLTEQTTRQPSPARRYEDYPSRSAQDYEQQEDRRPRQRGGDYDRDEWERTHQESRDTYDQSSLSDSRYYSGHHDQGRSSHSEYERYPSQTDSHYYDNRSYSEERPRQSTPKGPRAQYEDQYRQSYPYETERHTYDQDSYPPQDYPSRPSSSVYFNESRYQDESYRDDRPGYPDARTLPPELSHSTYPPQPPFPGDQNGISLPQPPREPSPPSAPSSSISSGIKPFTLKGKFLKNLKRTHEPDTFDSDRLVKSSRLSPRQTAPVMPPPPPVEIQQTQTPETPSNRDGMQEKRVTMREKGERMFERIGQVGEGTYGKVYKARNMLTGELVALKRIRMEFEKDGFPITAMREIKLLESLRHPNVIHLQEMMFEKSYVYMVFEYMDHDLAGILTHPNFTFEPSHIKDLLRQMLEGMHYLHHRGILHRDIKGSNILLSTNGLLKLADFGLARHYHKRRDNLDYSNRVITLWYRPPELLLGTTTYGPAVDIWSIGCIMLEIITKKATFPGQNEIDQLTRIWNIMGTPTAETWPKVVELPWWELVKPPAPVPEVFHRDYEGVLTPAALDLAFKLLALNPEQRPSASEALRHPYFTTELPKPERPTGLVLDGEWHEYESKNRKRVQKLKEQEARRAAPSSSASTEIGK